MSTNFEKISSNKVKLTFVVPAEDFDKALNQAYLKDRSKINVPGFRKGKAPRAVIERMYGEGVFYDDALDAIFPALYAEAIKEHNIDVVDRPQVDVQEIGAGKELKFTAEVFVRPDVTLGEYKNLTVEVEPKEVVTEDEIQARISQDQQKGARTIDVTDRGVDYTDTVNLDYAGSVDGVPFEGGTAQGQTLKIGSGAFIPGFEEQVAGHKIDEDFDVTVTFPEDYLMTDYAGKEAVFKCKIHSISKEEIPELTDDFVKEISDFDTVDEWKADAKKKLEENAEQTAKVGFENALVAKLIDKVQDPIPHCMFEQRADSMMDAFANQLKGQNVDLDLYLQYTGMTKDQLKETYLERAENEVKLRLALEKIAELEGLEVADEELDAELTKLAEQYNMTLDDVKARIPVAEYKLDMLVTKALDLVKDSAVVDNSEPAEAEAEKTEEAPAEDKDAE